MGFIYRKDWVKNGWKFRFDFVPYDATLSDPTTNISTANVTIDAKGFDVLERGFDGGLPQNLCLDSTLKIKLLRDRIPSDMADALDLKEVGGVRNLFMVFSDRGTGTISYLEYCGTHANVAPDDEEYSGSETIIEVDLMDAAHWLMTSTKCVDIFGAMGAEDTTPIYKLYEVGFGPSINRSDAYHDTSSDATGWSNGFKLTSWGFAWLAASVLMTNRWNMYIARTENATADATLEAFDTRSNLQQGLFDCVQLKTAALNAVRAPNAVLTSSSLQLVSHIYDVDGTTHIGGLFADQADKSWAKVESMRDLLNDLAENFRSKLYYNITYNDPTGDPYLALNWYWVPIAGDQTGDTVAATLDVNKSLTKPKLTGKDVLINQAETRFETESEEDVTEAVINVGASRGTRSFNTRICLHNAPVVKPDTDSESGDSAGFGRSYKNAVSLGLFQYDQIVHKVDTDTVHKIHEYVKIMDSFGSGVEYDDAHFETVPSDTDSTQLLAQYNLWVKEGQKIGTLGYAVADSLTRLWSNPLLRSITLSFRHSDYPQHVMGDALGRKYALTGDFVTARGQYAWNCAIVTNVKPDFTKGQSEITFALVAT